MNSVYDKSPLSLKKLMVNLYGVYQSRSRYTKDFYELLNKYIELDFVESKGLEHDRFRGIIDESGYYSHYLFCDNPIINKKVVKDNYDKILRSKYVKNYLYTSGTTGSGFKYPVSSEFIANQWAVFWKFRAIHGLTLDSWCAYFIGKELISIKSSLPPFWIKSSPTKQLLLSQYHLSQETVSLYLLEIIKNNIKWIHGYPSTLYVLAVYILNEPGLYEKIKGYDFNVITTSSETLYDYQKSVIQEVFKCPIRQLYGLTEGVANIYECDYGSYHIDEHFSYVELFGDDAGNEKNIVGTMLLNKAFPLIRYDTGDLCVLDEKKELCGCGRKGRTVGKVIGRDEDYVVLKNGVKVGRLDHIFKGFLSVAEAQIIQLRDKSIIVRIVRGSAYDNEDEKNIRKEIEKRIDVEYEIVYVNNIGKTKNGKHKFVISEYDGS